MRRPLLIAAWILGGVLGASLLGVAALYVAGNSAGGRVMIERVVAALSAQRVRLSGLGGSFPSDLTLEHLGIADERGVWLSADRISLHWFPLELLRKRVHVDKLRVQRLDIVRAASYPGTGGTVSMPTIEVDQGAIEVLALDAALAGRPARLELHGHARLESLEDASADVEARRIDGEGEGQYSLALRFDPARMDARLEVHEPAGGPLENILELPGLGALSAVLNIEGPREAERMDLTLSAGALTARAAGTVDLRAAAADFNYSIESPALRPRADLAWQRFALEGSWHGPWSAPKAQGRLTAAGLEAPGIGVRDLSAELSASGGALAVRATVQGLLIAGAQPLLLAQDPLTLDASVRLDDAAHPLVLRAAHRLFLLEARAIMAGDQRASFDLKLPDLAPFAAYLGQELHGGAAVKGELVRRASDVGVRVSADARLAGDTAGLAHLLEGRLALTLEGAVSAEAIDVQRLELKSPSLMIEARARALRTRRPAAGADSIEKLDGRWRFELANLGLLSNQLAGSLRASGRLAGAPAALAVDASLTSALSVRGSPMGEITGQIAAQGIGTAPSGSLKLHGMLDGAPLALDASLERGAGRALRVLVRAADWKSTHLAGGVDVVLAHMDESRGKLTLQVGDLDDLGRLLGVSVAGGVAGSVEFTPGAQGGQARFQLTGHDLRAGSFAGDAELDGRGTLDQLTLELAVHMPDLYGAAASLTSSAQLNFGSRVLHVAAASLQYRGEQIKLLAAANVELAKGIAIDRAELGMRNAVLALDGELWPALDLRASLRHLEPALVNAFVPELLAAGTIEAQIQLGGRLDAPSGDVVLSARGLKSGNADASGIPPLDLRAAATLKGDTAAIDVLLGAAGTSLLKVTGEVPLRSQRNLDLKVEGKLDIALASALLEARGMQASGQLAVNGAITGPPGDPELRGTLTLAQGKWRDYVHGLSLTDINAQLTGSGDTLRIASFKAMAASGSIGMTGTLGPLAPGMPIDISITASNAQPIASSLLTATLNADLHVHGTLLERIEIGGSLNVSRALIGVPDGFPPEVAILDVRRRGKAAAPATRSLVVGFDVSIHAPQEVLVQGRGLDAELGGDLRIRGTSDEPLVTGSLDLRRGKFSIAGSSLTFTDGHVTFGGAGLRHSIDPILDFSAQNSYTDITATLKITGYASAPVFTFSSSPTQAQDDILAILLFGQPAAQLGPLQAAQIGAALSGTSSAFNPLSKIQRTLGFDRLTVGSATTTTATGATQTTGASIGAGRYLSKRVYVEAKQTTTGQGQIQVDIELSKHLKLQTKLGNGTAIMQGTTPENDPGSSLGLIYQIEY